MIDAIVQVLSVPANNVRKSMGQFHDIHEFLNDTFGLVTVYPGVFWQEDLFGEATFDLRISYKARRKDKIPILSEGYRNFEESMDTIPACDYRYRDTTVLKDVMLFAECRKRLIKKFYEREVAIAPITKNY